MKAIKLLALCIACGCIAPAARADYAFSGSGPNGTLVSPTERWNFNADGNAAATGYLNDWGSPGVGFGVTAYGEANPAYGFVISFTGGGAIDAASIAIGNSSACNGAIGGGTTFCNTTAGLEPFEAFQTAPDTIEFLAQDPSFNLATGNDYFVNVFFDGATPTAFTGDWVTTFQPTPVATTPEPDPLVLTITGLALGVVGLSMCKRWVAQPNLLG